MIDCRIEQLGRDHMRDGFDCGQPSLDDFLHSLVNQYEKRNLGRTYVAFQGDDRRVLGYYTLASGAVASQSLPADQARKLPRHAVPVILLARLAVDRGSQGRGLGGVLLRNGMHRSLELSRKLGIHAIVVDALDARAKTFYERFGFVSFHDDSMRLYLPISTIEKAASQ